MKSFIAKRVISILVNLRYLRFKLLKYKEYNKKICNTFDHNCQKYSFIYNEQCIIRKVLFCIIRWCPYLRWRSCVEDLALKILEFGWAHILLKTQSMKNLFLCIGSKAQLSKIKVPSIKIGDVTISALESCRKSWYHIWFYHGPCLLTYLLCVNQSGITYAI